MAELCPLRRVSLVLSGFVRCSAVLGGERTYNEFVHGVTDGSVGMSIVQKIVTEMARLDCRSRGNGIARSGAR